MINAEFLQITTKPLQSNFMSQLDNFSHKLMQIFKSKGGVKVQRIKDVLAKIDLCDNINIRSECILRSLVIYLNEDPDTVFKEYLLANLPEDEKHPTKSTDELNVAIRATWASITPQLCQRLIASMPRHIDAIICDVLEVEEDQCDSMSLSSMMTPSSACMSLNMEMPRKRKGSMDNQDAKSASFTDADMEDDQNGSDGDDQHVKIKCFREPHSQIEKRRRDKMNHLIDKLSAMIPTCNPMSRKLDKLTVLRMAVQHLKSLKGSGTSLSEANYKPSFLPDEELKHLVLKAADGFLFVVGCDRGKIVFVSESVTKILNYSRAELIGQSLFDYIHQKDMGKVKEQLSASELYPRERLIDAKTGLQVQADLPVGAARLCSGTRRSFFCRMKYNKISVKVEDKEFQSNSSKKKEVQKYCTVHCTGYMRSWATSQLGVEGEGEADKQDSSHFSCLVAVGRIHSHSSPQVNGEVRVKATEFTTRYAMDGKFTFVDQRATTILGYLPQELLGTSCYEYFHQDDLPHLADRHRKVLRSKEKIETNCYKFKTKHGSFVTLQSQWFSFVNPWTKEVEYIVSTNTVISHDLSRTSRSGNKSELSSNSKTHEDGKKSFPVIPGVSTAPGAMIYAGSIGTQIANELLDFNRMNSSPSSGNTSPFSLPPDKCAQTHNQNSNNVPNGEVTDMEVPGKSSSEDEPQGAAFSGGDSLMGENSQLDLDSVVGPGLSSLSNDEAAMAVIMSLLETDTNLGEAVDFEEMHWSL
ncbi:aryl hydrocarbon receptor nuclear translocator-like protein 2 isoform X3 [Notolabrus celidotus]|uniref:aryl hydrocarbon receptor nuclear translocator-like protein 2 isoform X3 n=1 Tax=Notolabrus celidotus TaxID=1203425 RepID=UPI00149011AF|nr:aryl hydrocarbon receptor nuclear translocator-like protein 2 isoform X3 [Notolabrus celidotus]